MKSPIWRKVGRAGYIAYECPKCGELPLLFECTGMEDWFVVKCKCGKRFNDSGADNISDAIGNWNRKNPGWQKEVLLEA